MKYEHSFKSIRQAHTYELDFRADPIEKGFYEITVYDRKSDVFLELEVVSKGKGFIQLRAKDIYTADTFMIVLVLLHTKEVRLSISELCPQQICTQDIKGYE